MRGLSRARRVLSATRQQWDARVDPLRPGPRVVLRTPPAGMRVGNLLYLWLHAHLRRAQGEDVAVLATDAMASWWDAFPATRALSIPRAELRFRDRREWEGAWLYQRFGTDFTREHLQAFIRDVLAAPVRPERGGPLLLNVRRGDFYGTEFEAKHGFQIVPYVTAALDQFPHARRVQVVSDDAAWCREHLGPSLRTRFDEVDYAAPHPLENLLSIARAESIIGANSTFSYWGAYMADALHDDARIVMPRFHARMAHGNAAFQLDPRWIALDGFA